MFPSSPRSCRWVFPERGSKSKLLRGIVEWRQRGGTEQNMGSKHRRARHLWAGFVSLLRHAFWTTDCRCRPQCFQRRSSNTLVQFSVDLGYQCWVRWWPLTSVWFDMHYNLLYDRFTTVAGQFGPRPSEKCLHCYVSFLACQTRRLLLPRLLLIWEL